MEKKSQNKDQWHRPDFKSGGGVSGWGSNEVWATCCKGALIL